MYAFRWAETATLLDSRGRRLVPVAQIRQRLGQSAPICLALHHLGIHYLIRGLPLLGWHSFLGDLYALADKLACPYLLG